MRRRWRRPRRVKVQWKLIFTLILLGIMLFIMDKSLKPIMEAVSENEARVSAMQTIQETVLQELETGDITYSDLVDVQRDDAGNILAITTNIVRMNELKSGMITSDEYYEWKINWLKTCDDCGKYEPKKQWRKNF